MKSVTVKENGVDVYVQYEGPTQNVLHKTEEEYSNFSDYFDDLIKVSSEVVGKGHLHFVLNVDHLATLMTLNLTEEELPLAEKLKSRLLTKLHDDIEQISIVGNQLNIVDFLYEFH